MMARWLAGYEEFLLNNASHISGIESTLRSITYVLPGRFHDAELASEALFAALNLLGLYHDAIIVRALATRRHRVTAGESAAPGSSSSSSTTALHNQYTRTLWQSDSGVRRAALALTLIKATEVTVEMIAKRSRGGDAMRWRVVTVIELLKATLRGWLLHRSGRRMLLAPVHPLRDVDPATVEEEAVMATTTQGQELDEGVWRGSRTGKRVPQLSTVLTAPTGPGNGVGLSDLLLAGGGGGGEPDSVMAFLSEKALTEEAVLGPLQLVHPRRHTALLGEWLHILRPVLYVLAIRRYGLGAWRPWLLSLVVELLARAAAQQQALNRPTELEEGEMSRRKRLLFLYLLRSPFYYRFTKSRVDGLRNWLSSKPLLSLLGGILGNYQPLWETVYFYTAGS